MVFKIFRKLNLLVRDPNFTTVNVTVSSVADLFFNYDAPSLELAPFEQIGEKLHGQYARVVNIGYFNGHLLITTD